MRAVLWCALAGCYAPSVPAGSPCSTAVDGPRCPDGLVCKLEGAVEICVDADYVPIDAPIDPSIDAPSDRDLDGVFDVADLCPDIADPAQANEDGDRFGDACDPCPPIADDAPPDPDGDGVGGACDPNPTTPGDRIVLFTGFHAGVPAGWTVTGTWADVGGAVAAAPASDEQMVMFTPIVPDLTGTASASFVVTSIATGGRGMGIALPLSLAADRGIICEPFLNTGTQNRKLGLVRLDNLAVLADTAVAWLDNKPLVASVTRMGSTFTCRFEHEGLTHVLTAMDANSPPDPRVAFRTRSISGRVEWMMYVDSP